MSAKNDGVFVILCLACTHASKNKICSSLHGLNVEPLLTCFNTILTLPCLSTSPCTCLQLQVIYGTSCLAASYINAETFQWHHNNFGNMQLTVCDVVKTLHTMTKMGFSLKCNWHPVFYSTLYIALAWDTDNLEVSPCISIVSFFNELVEPLFVCWWSGCEEKHEQQRPLWSEKLWQVTTG